MLYIINTCLHLHVHYFIASEYGHPGTDGWGCRIHRLHLYKGYDSPNECPGYDSKQSDGEGSNNAGALGNAKYPFIAITPKSTLAESGKT